MEFHKILLDLMDEKSLTVPDITRMTGLTDSTLRSIISRKTKTVTLEVAFKLSKGLNVSLHRLNGTETKTLELNDEETNIVVAYRKSPDMHDAIKKLLGV